MSGRTTLYIFQIQSPNGISAKLNVVAYTVEDATNTLRSLLLPGTEINLKSKDTITFGEEFKKINNY